jgi:hypothetical protein
MIRSSGRRVRHALVIAGVTAAYLFAVSAGPAHADPDVDLDCTITVTSDVYPGEIFAVLQQLTGTSHGPTGTADCTGTVDGEQVTGLGTFGVNSHEEGDCGATQTTGRNNFVLRVPTTGGDKTVPGVYADTSQQTSGGFVILLSGDITGTAEVLSVVGDCSAANPLTQVTVQIQGHVA